MVYFSNMYFIAGKVVNKTEGSSYTMSTHWAHTLWIKSRNGITRSRKKGNLVIKQELQKPRISSIILDLAQTDCLTKSPCYKHVALCQQNEFDIICIQVQSSTIPPVDKPQVIAYRRKQQGKLYICSNSMRCQILLAQLFPNSMSIFGLQRRAKSIIPHML